MNTMKSTPSILALLGLVAVAGYQNRSKISEMLDDAKQRQAGSASAAQPSLFSDIAGIFGSGGRSSLSSGLADLVRQFTAAGHGNAAQSWVAPGQNKQLQEQDFAQVIGDDTLDELVTKTGLSRAELIHRLTAAVPKVINQLTPEGRLPTEAEAEKLL